MNIKKLKWLAPLLTYKKMKETLFLANYKCCFWVFFSPFIRSSSQREADKWMPRVEWPTSARSARTRLLAEIWELCCLVSCFPFLGDVDFLHQLCGRVVFAAEASRNNRKEEGRKKIHTHLVQVWINTCGGTDGEKNTAAAATKRSEGLKWVNASESSGEVCDDNRRWFEQRVAATDPRLPLLPPQGQR